MTNEEGPFEHLQWGRVKQKQLLLDHGRRRVFEQKNLEDDEKKKKRESTLGSSRSCYSQLTC